MLSQPYLQKVAHTRGYINTGEIFNEPGNIDDRRNAVEQNVPRITNKLEQKI